MAVIVHHGDSRDVLKTIADASIDSCVCDPPYALLACIGEGFNAILIEREAEYVADIHRRIAWVKGDGRLTAQEVRQPAQDAESALPLFASLAGAE
jgi:DNA modification methylase